MARKLKSDRLLFLTTILLVGLSIVMVYSASAVVTLERYGKPSMFLIKQGMWAVLGVAMLGVFMRIDYPNAADRRRFAELKAKGVLPRSATIGGCRNSRTISGL